MCGRKLVTSLYGWICPGDKKNDPASCRFTARSEAGGQKITEEMLAAVIRDGRWPELMKFKKKSGGSFEAFLVLKPRKDKEGNPLLDAQGRQVTGIGYEFPMEEEAEVEGAACPMCGKTVMKTGQGYRCSGNVKGDASSCQFFVFRAAGGKEVTEDILRTVLSGGEAGPYKLKKKGGGTFEASLVLAQRKDKSGSPVTGADGKPVLGLGYRFQAGEETGMECPMCGSQLVKNKYGYRCTENPSSCQFFAYGEVCGVPLTDGIMKKLLSGQKTDVMQFTSKKGKEFPARLVLGPKKDKEGNALLDAAGEQILAVNLEMEKRTQDGEASSIECPECGRRLVKEKWNYVCACGYRAPAFFAHKWLTEEQVKKLASGKKTEVIKGFTKKDGSTFDAALYIKEDGSLGLDFPKSGKKGGGRNARGRR